MKDIKNNYDVMIKRFLLSLFLTIFFSLFSLARAEVLINEAQLSPIAERFLELYNNGDSAVDLTGWYMQRKTAAGDSFGSLVSNPNFENKTIGAHEYFVISRNSLNNSDIVLDSLTLTESNIIQIKNREQEIIDKIGWGNECNGSCAPNPADGESVQRDRNGSLIIGTPTPGAKNSSNSEIALRSPNDSSNFSASNINSSTATASASKPQTAEAPSIKAKILANSLVFTGQPLEMQTNISGFSNENIVRGRVYWNFGDGGSLEQINNFEKFHHIYYYPGDYVVFLEYYGNNFSNTPEATSKMIIKVVSTAVVISKVGEANDFFIELSNNASFDIDVSNWFINANGKIFTLPKNSVILSKKPMTLSPRITGFASGDQSGLKLFSSTGEIVFDYSASMLAPVAIVPPKTADENARESKVSANQNQKNPKTVKPIEITMSAAEKEIPSPNFPVSADLDLSGSAEILESNVIKNNSIRTYLLTTILTVFLGVSAGSVYLIRRKKIVSADSAPGDDFKILDE